MFDARSPPDSSCPVEIREASENLDTSKVSQHGFTTAYATNLSIAKINLGNMKFVIRKQRSCSTHDIMHYFQALGA